MPAASRRRPFVRDPAAERLAEVNAHHVPALRIARARVPKVIHFVFGLSPTFGGKPFNLMHQVAVASAVEQIRPEQVFFHYQHLPDTPSFTAIRSHLTLNKITAPEAVFGRKLSHFAHRADIVRIATLLEHGGIYLDLDTVTVAPFDRLLSESFTIGIQGRNIVDGLCNAVMLATPKHKFLSDWFDCYRRFDDAHWDRFSVRLPYAMWRSGNWSINVEPYDTFHWPGWDQKGLEMMFERELSFPNALCHHLWESHCFEQYFAGDSKAIASRIRTGRSTYSRLARPYI